MSIIPTDRKLKPDVADSAPLDDGDKNKKQPKPEVKLNKVGDVLVNDPTLPQYEEKDQTKMKSFNEFQESLSEAKKLIGSYSNDTGHVTKVYKLSGEHNEGDPYHVKLFKGGKHYKPADYFTNDESDAHGTAKSMVKEEAESDEALTVEEITPVQSAAARQKLKQIEKSGVKKSQALYDKLTRLANAHPVKEEVVSELNLSTIQSYIKKAGASIQSKSKERAQAKAERHASEIKAGTRAPGEVSDSAQHKPSGKETKLSGEITKKQINIRKAERKAWEKNTAPEKLAARTSDSHKKLNAAIRSSDVLAVQLAKRKDQHESETLSATDKQKLLEIADQMLDEISKETLKSYIPKAMGSKEGADFMRGVKMEKGTDEKGTEELRKKSAKRSEGIATAIRKLTKESQELDEAYLHDPDTYLRMATQAREQGKILRAALLTRIAAAVRRNDLSTAMTLRRSLPATQE